MESKVIPNDLAGFCVPISDTGLLYSTLLQTQVLSFTTSAMPFFLTPVGSLTHYVQIRGEWIKGTKER